MTATAMPGTLPPLGRHQDLAINAIMDNERMLIRYSTGTGKTRIMVESIGALVRAGEIPVLVLVPNSLIEQTADEFATWLGKTWVGKHLCILDGSLNISTRRQLLRYGKSSVYILSHEAMSYPLIREGLVNRRWAAAFLDEASRFRNYSNRTKTLLALGRRTDTRYAFTGNLAPRVPSDVWYVSNWLQPGLFGTTNRQVFLTSYCLMGGFEGRQPIALRPDKLAQFKTIMSGIQIEAELSDIRTMPDRVLHVHRVDMDSKTRSAYKQMQEELRLEIERVSEPVFRSHVRTYATRLQRLQEITSGFARNIDREVVGLPSAKTGAMLDVLDYDPQPTIIWGWWVPELDAICATLSKEKINHVRLGKDPDAVQRFMSGDVDVFVAQVGQGGYGLNLTRATRLIYHSQPWSLDVYLQSQERNMRLTTTAPRLEVIHLVTRNSVDEYVRQKLLERADISSQLTRSQALELLRT